MYMIPNAIEMWARGDCIDKENDECLQKYLTKTSMYGFATMPAIRDMANVEYGYNFSPVTQVIERGIPATLSIVGSAFNDDEITKAQWKNASKLIGAGFKIPGISQTWSTGEHLYDVLELNEELTFRELAITGPRKK